MKRAWDFDPSRSTSRLDYLIGEYINGPNCEKYRAILRLHFLQGMSQAAIAEAVEMSDTQVGRVIRKYGDKLLLML